MSMFKKAEKSAARIRMAFVGPSGSGKTYSALRIATGISGRIVLIDTERGSGCLYADKFEYDYAEMTPPYSPEKYIEIIHSAEKEGYEIIILDSLTHAWAGEGGLLDQVEKLKLSGKYKNEFAVWAEATPKQNRLFDVILSSSCHILATLRAKTAYEMEDRNGKKIPKKIGLAPIQREGTDYEFTLVADLSVGSHVASFSKNRTGLFKDELQVPDEQMGEAIRGWLTEQKPAEPYDPQDVLEKIVVSNHKKIEELVGHKLASKTVAGFLTALLKGNYSMGAAQRAEKNPSGFLSALADSIKTCEMKAKGHAPPIVESLPIDPPSGAPDDLLPPEEDAQDKLFAEF